MVMICYQVWGDRGRSEKKRPGKKGTEHNEEVTGNENESEPQENQQLVRGAQ